MTPPDPTLRTAEALSTQLVWVRALAHSLVPDPGLAEDLSQETCVRALEGAPHEGGPAKSWLAGILRNLIRQSRRTDRRRVRREQEAARDEATSSAFDIVERASTHRELVDSVLELEEPYRTTLLMRFYDDMPQREIAKALGIATPTVNTRIQRGLKMLRARLDRKHEGDRQAWVMTLLPVLDRSGTSGLATAVATGSLIVMNIKLLILVVGLVGAGVLTLAWSSRSDAVDAVDSPTAMVDRGQELSADLTEPVQDTVFVEGGARTELTADPVAAEGSHGVEAAPEVRVTVSGRVLDLAGRSVSSVDVQFIARIADAAVPDEEMIATTRADGTFKIPVPEGGGRFVVRSDEYSTLLSGTYKPQSEIEPVVVIAPSIALGGVVVDDRGTEIEGAVVRVDLPRNTYVELGERLDSLTPPSWTSETDEDGAFFWKQAPRVEGGLLRVAYQGFETHVSELPPQSREDLVIQLRRPDAAGRVVRGQVLDARSMPVPGAYVSMGLYSTAADDKGFFEIDPDHLAANGPLIAVEKGMLPAVMERPADGDWPDFVYLKLGGEPLTLAGRVVDSHGKAVEHARLWLGDPTMFSVVGESPAHVEHVLSKSESKVRYNNFLIDADPPEDWETPDAGAPTDWAFFECDASGRFEIDGLMDRHYRLHVMDPTTFVFTEYGPARAGGPDVTIELPSEAVHRSVRGRLLSQLGRPVSGVRMVLVTTTFEAAVPFPGGTLRASSNDNLEPIVVGEGGAFEFRDVPKDNTRIFFYVVGDEIIPQGFDLEPDADIRNLEFRVKLRLHMRIDLEDPELADSFSVLDENEEHVAVHVLRADTHDFFSDAMPLREGRSEVLVVPEGAVYVELYKQGEAVERVPVDLKPGEVNVVRF